MNDKYIKTATFLIKLEKSNVGIFFKLETIFLEDFRNLLYLFNLLGI